MHVALGTRGQEERETGKYFLSLSKEIHTNNERQRTKNGQLPKNGGGVEPVVAFQSDGLGFCSQLQSCVM